MAALVLLTNCSSKIDPTFLSTDITNASFGKDFKLSDHNGDIRSLNDFKDKVVVLFFGYTNCPDICPSIMGKLAGAIKKLGKDSNRVQVLFVSVDPEHDTPELLKQYVSTFNPTFLGLSGDLQTTRNLAKKFKIIFQKQAGITPDNYTMDHSTGVFIFDVTGSLRLYVNSSTSMDIISHDILELLKTS
ncbi:MAG: SCO family protein [Nitrosomonadales bacterium]|jgi:protein SCO1/2|nr:MAG: SCO family protein [Nitrosomonadales bacterium]